MGVMRRNVRRARSSVVLSTVLLTLFALVAPFAGSAIANHGTRTLDLDPETAENAVGSDHTITATLSAAADAGSGSIQIDFEWDGDADGDDTTPPDDECVIAIGDDDCDVVITSATAGVTTVRGWIDHDGLNSAFEGDATEGADAATEPGDNTNEPDITDVVEKEWFEGLPTGSVLDCTDEDGGDDIVNPLDDPDDAETYTCTLVDASDDPIAGITIDAENLNGANDADNSAAPGTADWDDACTTDAAGACDVTVDAAESEAGTADICFWADGDADDDFDQGGSADDGGECGEALGPDNNNQTDRVRKTWEARAFSELEIDPVIDVNQNGEAHTVTVTAVDQFGDPIAVSNIDINIIAGPNAGPGVDDVSTNAQGVYTFTYTDTVGNGTDVIEACIDDNDDDLCDAPGTTVTADKIWIDEVATADDVELDMDGCDGDTTDLTDASWDDAATNGVTDVHTICASAVTAGGQVLYGHTITFTSTGPGEFLDANGDSLGTTTDVVIDGSDYAVVDITSTVSGDQAITVTIDGQNDTGTKTWEAGNARNLDLTPDAASNNPGTIHTLSALVTDALGNPVPGVEVTFTETGAGVFRDGSSTFTATTGGDGIAVAETTTLETETGEQQLTATIDETAPGVDCELEADDPDPGDPEGNCTDTAVKRWGPTCPGFQGDIRNQIVGTDGRDRIRGTDADDVICGLGGKDVLRGAQGNDVIKGGAGNDTMRGGAGDDSLRGNKGPDKAFGGPGTDVCRSAKVQKGCES